MDDVVKDAAMLTARDEAQSPSGRDFFVQTQNDTLIREDETGNESLVRSGLNLNVVFPLRTQRERPSLRKS